MQFSASSKQNPQLQSREIQIKLVQCPSCLNNILFDDNVFSHFKSCNPKLFEDFVNYLSQGGQVSDVRKTKERREQNSHFFFFLSLSIFI